MADALDKELRRLAAYGRKQKNKLLVNGALGTDLDLQPEAHIWRDGEHVALMKMHGNGRDTAEMVSIAATGYGADEIIGIWDAFGYFPDLLVQTPEEARDHMRTIPSGTLSKWFYSDDPELSSRVSEALWCIRWTKVDDEVESQVVMVPYVYSKTKNRFRWTEPYPQEDFGGPLVEDISAAMKTEDLFSAMDRLLKGTHPFSPQFNSRILEGASGLDSDVARLHADLAITKMLLGKEIEVALRFDPKHRERVQESMKDYNVTELRV